MSTRRTQLRRRKKPLQWKICPPIPVRLIFQFAEYFGKPRVSNVSGKIMIFQHPDYVQPFHKDRLVFADDLRRELPKRISSGVADFGVQSRHSESGFLSIITILDLTRQPALKYQQSLFMPDERARIFDLLAVAGRGQRLNTNVYPDFGFGLFEWFNIGFNQDAHKIASTCVSANRQIENFSVIRKRATPNNKATRLLPRVSQDIGSPPAISKEPRKCYATSDSAWSGEGKCWPSPAEPISLCSATFVYSARRPSPREGIYRELIYTYVGLQEA
jgi:hypothetical protein